MKNRPDDATHIEDGTYYKHDGKDWLYWSKAVGWEVNQYGVEGGIRLLADTDLIVELSQAPTWD